MTDDEQTILSLTRENERLRMRIEQLERQKRKPAPESPIPLPGPVCQHKYEQDCPICDAPPWKFWLWLR